MDDVDLRVQFLMQLIECCYSMMLISYKPDDFLEAAIDFDADFDMNDRDAVEMVIATSVKAPVARHIEAKRETPLYIDSELGLIWIAGFDYDSKSIRRIYLIGPAFSGKNNFETLKAAMDTSNYSVKSKAAVFRYFERTPVIPTNTLFQYGLMLHFCITGKRITVGDLTYAYEEPASGRTLANSEAGLITSEHRGVREAEQQFLDMIRRGDAHYAEWLSRISQMSDGPRVNISDSRRKARSNAVVLLTLVSRAAMEGGLRSNIAYDMIDHYMQLILEAPNEAELANIAQPMVSDFVEQVQKANTHADVSPEVAAALAYIDSHIREDIAITDVAAVTGYSEYYFARKFRHEMGTGINEYIRAQKIEQAKFLLSATANSISEIADTLSFSSRSYFAQVFAKETGMSPSEYRLNFP